MSLNLKNDEVHELARKLAALTGETMTAAVTEAVRERIERVSEQRRGSDNMANRLMAIGRDCAARMKEPWRSVDHGELLYGEDGLPR